MSETNEEQTIDSDIRERVTGFAMNLIKTRFGNSANLLDRLAYHNQEHTAGVIRRATRIGQAIGLSERDLTLMTIAAAFHDVVQNYHLSYGNGLLLKRLRFSGKNEELSVFEAVNWMKINYFDIFNNEDISLVTSAIKATTPSWDTINKTCVQRFLDYDSHPVIRAVALADLSTPGMESESFRRESNELFIEDHIGLMLELRGSKSLDEACNQICVQRQDLFLKAYREWLNNQIGFVKGRQALLETELGGLNEEVKTNVKLLFSYFNVSLTIAVRDAQEAEFYDFKDLIKHLMEFGLIVQF